MTSPARELIASIRRALPAGSTLPDDLWRRRHTGIVALLWAHAVFVPFFALARGFGVVHTVLEGAILPVTALIASSGYLARRTSTVAASFGLLSASAVLVHLSGGTIEMHFHFFVMVAVVALYQDWLPFLMSIGYVLVHHGIAGAIDPRSVFNHPAALNHPWRWASIHALFVAGISVACLVTWRLNETMLARQKAAEAALREESRAVETLHYVGQTLAADLDLKTVIQRVTDASTTITAAGFGAFFYNAVDEAGESYMLYTLSGVPAEAFASFPMPRNTAVFAPTFAGEGAIRLDDVTTDARYGKSGPHFGMPVGHLPVRSYLAVPVRARSGDVLGGLFFGHPEPGQFSELDERIVTGIASQAAVAIDNARLYESERESRELAEQAQRRLLLLAEAGRILSSTLEFDRTLANLCHLLSPTLADSCIVYLLNDAGWIEQAAIESTTRPDGDGAPEIPPIDPQHPHHPVAVAIRTGTSMLIPEVADDLLDRSLDDVAERSLAQQVGPTSAVVVPLIAGERAIGAIALGTVRASARRLNEDDLRLVEELARRAGVAIEQARLFRLQRDVATTLQHSLLPDELPVIPGIETAVRYLPGGPGVEVGGDFYDVLAFADGSIGLVMGDVVGRGIPAASLMGQLRNALRAFAFDGRSPADALDRLNRLVHEIGGPRSMATVVYAIFDPETLSLCMANAGHPPPLLRLPDGRVRYVEGGLGPPLGAVPNAEYSEVGCEVESGATLVLYTDGLVEDRQLSLDAGLDRLAEVVRAGPSEVEALCDHVVTGALAGREASDDTAMLAMRCVALDGPLHLTVPARPTVLRPLRTTLRRWLTGIGASEQESFEILVATGEACANAVQHSGMASPTFQVDARADGDVTIAVRDFGSWREPRPSVGGRGLPIMRQFMDDVDVRRSPDGTEVVMRRALEAGVRA